MSSNIRPTQSLSHIVKQELARLRAKKSFHPRALLEQLKHEVVKSPLNYAAKMVDRVTNIFVDDGQEQSLDSGSKKGPTRYADIRENENKATKKYSVPSREEIKVFQFGVKKLLTLQGRWTFAKYREYHSVKRR